ncbi:MAG: hypothetical protein V1734_01705 [Nanoarchaeota archaeon]
MEASERINNSTYTVIASVRTGPSRIFNKEPGLRLMQAIALPYDGCYLVPKTYWTLDTDTRIEKFRLANACINARNKRDYKNRELTPIEFENAYNGCVMYRELFGCWSHQKEVSFQEAADEIISEDKPHRWWKRKIKIEKGYYGLEIFPRIGIISLEETEKIRGLIKAYDNKGLTKIVMDLLKL